MSNYVKYSTNAQTNALKIGNFWLGPTNDGKGPTSSTGYYTAFNPTTGTFVVYVNKASNGPAIYSASNESQLVSITNKIAGTSYTTSAQCLTYYVTQTDKFCVNREYEGIVTDGLVLNLDAGFTPSYPTSGTSWYDLSTNSRNGSLLNGTNYNSSNGGSIVFDGSDDGVSLSSSLSALSQISCEMWVKIDPSNITGPFVAGWILGIEGEYRMLYGGNTFTWVCRAGQGWYSSGTAIGYDYGSSISNLWFHVVGTYNGSFNSLYVNGVLRTIGSNISGNVNGGNFTIGTSGAGNVAYTKGNVSMVRIYNRGLSSIEVLQNYNTQKGRFGL